MNDHSFSEKLLRFLNGKGFYIALVCCLAAVGGSGWYLWREASTARTLAAQVSQVQEVTVDSADEPEADPNPAPAELSTPAEAPAPAEEVPAAPSVAVTELDEEPEVEAAAEPEERTAPEPDPAEPTVLSDADEAAIASAAWVWPLEGQVVSAFSADSLRYNAALQDWRTHDGVDLSAEPNEPVFAAHAGTVISVRDDVLLGKTVTMDLGDGLTASYSNLDTEVLVSSGDELEAGDPIGTVGESAAGEHNDTPWLHFCVEQDGQAVDPLGFLSPTP